LRLSRSGLKGERHPPCDIGFHQVLSRCETADTRRPKNDHMLTVNDRKGEPIIRKCPGPEFWRRNDRQIGDGYGQRVTVLFNNNGVGLAKAHVPLLNDFARTKCDGELKDASTSFRRHLALPKRVDCNRSSQDVLRGDFGRIFRRRGNLGDWIPRPVFELHHNRCRHCMGRGKKTENQRCKSQAHL
jgi:hypothetical protein